MVYITTKIIDEFYLNKGIQYRISLLDSKHQSEGLAIVELIPFEHELHCDHSWFKYNLGVFYTGELSLIVLPNH